MIGKYQLNVILDDFFVLLDTSVAIIIVHIVFQSFFYFSSSFIRFIAIQIGKLSEAAAVKKNLVPFENEPNEDEC